MSGSKQQSWAWGLSKVDDAADRVKCDNSVLSYTGPGSTPLHKALTTGTQWRVSQEVPLISWCPLSKIWINLKQALLGDVRSLLSLWDTDLTWTPSFIWTSGSAFLDAWGELTVIRINVSGRGRGSTWRMQMHFTTLVKPPKISQGLFSHAVGGMWSFTGVTLYFPLTSSVCIPCCSWPIPCDVPAMNFCHRRIFELLPEHPSSIQVCQ